MADGPEVRVSVLGPLQLTVGGRTVEVPGSRRRAVLAVLAMAAPAPVSADRLVDTVWPHDPPESGRAALQSHVSRLRRHLGAAAGRLASTGAGYRLELRADELDANRAESLVSEARACAGADPRAAGQLLRAARDLWRGPPLADLDDTPALTAWSRSLTELWLDASDLLVRCHLDAGDPATAARIAMETLDREPLREDTVILLVRALAVQGRSAEALRAAHDYRRRLADETGLEPTPALGAVEHAVASGEAAAPRVPDLPPPRRQPPTPPAPLLGRDAELAGVARLLDAERLVTMVGPGGVGKTHLALEVARRARRRRDVTVVHLSSVTDGGAVPDALADALGVRGDAGDLVERCALRLRPGRQLVVLDNCEHVLGPARELVAVLLGQCPRLGVLATSRERLALAAEQTCWLGPLALPDADQRADLGTVPSVALFLDRARRTRARLDLDDADMAVVARVVRALDGLPLAIELAAGRLSSMNVADLEARLDRALDLFTAAAGDATGAAARHRTLRATVEWSYDLLPPDERRLFRNLAVFPGGFDLATAEMVARELGIEADPAAVLAHLVDASVIVAELDAGPRYRMLDTLRTFGLDRLGAEGEEDAASRRLVRWAVELARWLEQVAATADEARADARLRTELANLRTAWRTARTAGDIDSAASLVVALYWAVSWRELTEVWRWALELADDPQLDGHPDQAAVLGTASEAAWFSRGDLDRAEALARRGLEVAGPGDSRGRSMASWALGDVCIFRGRFEDARALVLDARRETEWEAEGWAQAAFATAYAGDLDEARRLLARAEVAAVSPTLRGYVRYVDGEIAGLAHDHGAAAAAYRDAIAAAEASGATFLEGIASVGLVSVQVAAGDVDDALDGYRALIDRWERTGGWTQQWTTLRNLAEFLDRLGDRGTARTLREAADRAPEAAAVSRSPAAVVAVADEHPAEAAPERLDRQEVLALARAAIDRALAGDRT